MNGSVVSIAECDRGQKPARRYSAQIGSAQSINSGESMQHSFDANDDASTTVVRRRAKVDPL